MIGTPDEMRAIRRLLQSGEIVEMQGRILRMIRREMYRQKGLSMADQVTLSDVLSILASYTYDGDMMLRWDGTLYSPKELLEGKVEEVQICLSDPASLELHGDEWHDGETVGIVETFFTIQLVEDLVVEGDVGNISGIYPAGSNVEAKLKLEIVYMERKKAA